MPDNITYLVYEQIFKKLCKSKAVITVKQEDHSQNKKNIKNASNWSAVNFCSDANWHFLTEKCHINVVL